MTDWTSPFVLIMLAYFALTVLVAWWSGRGSSASYREFTLAGRDLSLPVYMMTYFATFTGGGLTMGIAQQAFLGGISAQWYAMTEGLAWMSITVMLGFLYAFDVVSVPELLGEAFGSKASYFAAAFTVVGQVALTAGQTIGMASVISVALGVPLELAFWVSTAVFVGITVYGGMHSVAWADTLHGVIVIAGMVIAIPIALSNAGGWETVTASVPAGHMNWFGVGLVQIGSWYLMYLTVAGAQQQMLQRTWSAGSRRIAIVGTFLSGAVIVGYGILTTLSGLIANAQGADIASSMAFAWTMKNALPPALGGLLLAAAVGAIMSGADSFLLAGATTFVNDVYLPARGGHQAVSDVHLVRAVRLTILAFGVIAATVAISGVKIIAINTLGMGIMSVLFAGVLALFWPRTTDAAGLPAFAVGGVVFVVWQFVLGEPALFGEGTLEAAVPSTAAALLTLGAVSALGYGERIDLEGVRTKSGDARATDESPTSGVTETDD